MPNERDKLKQARVCLQWICMNLVSSSSLIPLGLTIQYAGMNIR